MSVLIVPPLLARLVAIQVMAWGTTGLLVVAFARRLLLLDADVVGGSEALALLSWLLAIVLVLAATAVVTRKARPVVYELALGIAAVAPVDVLSLYAVPARLVAIGLGGTLLASAATLLSPLRPATNDLSTQIELILLTMTIASVAALPAYVAMRASVAKVMELVSVAVSRQAIELLEARGRQIARVRRRLIVAVVAPVAFVALGASLLVHAHLRAFETSSREEGAVELARGVLDPATQPPDRGLLRSLEEARARGFDVHLWQSGAPFAASRDEDGSTLLTVPLDEGHAVVRFRQATVSRAAGLYLGLALAALLIAVALGSRIGRAFADDVALATRELEATGVADVLRGGRIRGGARFQSVAGLLHAANDLGGVFREFASAQQRGIDARAAAERMRGSFLTSMSHDLKAPLNATLGFAELVSRGPLTDGQRESVGIIAQRGRELLHLIDTILDTARVEAGELSISPEWIDVGEVVTSAVLDARDLAVRPQPNITGEIQPGLPHVLADAARLAQALTAMILVATRFAESGHVVVRAALPVVGERLRIDVEVTGRVVAAADRDKVFDAFKQTDRARRHGSLGLGPSLARALVELHGGGIEVETTEAGGTVFHLWVPSERPSRAPPPP